MRENCQVKKKTLFRRTKHVNISRNSEDALRSQIAKYIHGLLAFHFPSHVRLDVCPHALHALLCGDSATTLQSGPTSGTTMPDTHIGLNLPECRSESATGFQNKKSTVPPTNCLKFSLFHLLFVSRLLPQFFTSSCLYSSCIISSFSFSVLCLPTSLASTFSHLFFLSAPSFSNRQSPHFQPFPAKSSSVPRTQCLMVCLFFIFNLLKYILTLFCSL